MSQRNTVSLILAGVVLIGAAFIVKCASNSNQQTNKNRVPTLQDQVGQAQQSAKAAQEAADRSEHIRQDLQTQIDKLNSTQRSSDGSPKEGRAEITAPGAVSNFGAFRIEAAPPGDNSSSDDYYLGFTFTDRHGFTKRFFPVCPNQSIPTSATLSFMYHWRSWQSTSAGARGCYQIDGAQQQ